MKYLNFKYKGEDVIVELNTDNTVNWVYAYNMRMNMSVVPEDLKLEVGYIVNWSTKELE